MLCYEFKVIPAPRRGEKARGIKTTEERFALALTTVMNELGREGWDYVRADTLPVDERAGFTGTKTSFQNMLVFRRVLSAVADGPKPGFSSVDTALNAPPRLGPADMPSGLAPALGSANASMAAE